MAAGFCCGGLPLSPPSSTCRPHLPRRPVSPTYPHPHPQINYVTWSPNSKTVAFTLRSAGGDADPPRQPLELWVADMATGQARRLLDHRLNSVFEE